MQVRPLPSASRLEGRITLLGGRLAGTGPWREQREGWVDSGAALRVYKRLHRGLNAIDYDRFRRLIAVAIYFPDAAAAQRVRDAYGEPDRVTRFDIF